MTKKDYIMLTNLIYDNARTVLIKGSGVRHVIKYGNFINALCTELAKDNPKFNEDKFREACGEVLAK